MVQHYRVGRLSQEIQREVNDILVKRVRDPRVSGVTITGVEVTGDLQNATIYYSILSIYVTPEIKFEQDQSVRYGNRIDELLNQLHQQD